MSGRIYDPVIGRFLTADPFVQAQENSQSLNRYSYCLNNPLALTDPSGFGWLSKMWRVVVGVAVGIVATVLCTICPPAGIAAWSVDAWSFGIGVGAAVAGITTAGLGLATGNGLRKSLEEGILAAGIVATLGAGAKEISSHFGPPNLPDKNSQDPAPEDPKEHSDGGASAQQGSAFSDHTLAAASNFINESNNPILNFDATRWLSDRLDNGFVVGSTAASYGGEYSNGVKTSAWQEICGWAGNHPGESMMAAGAALAFIGPFTGIGAAVIEPIAGGLSFVGRALTVYERVVSSAELEATQETGLLRGGREGDNFFTNKASLDAKRAQIRLGLDGPLRNYRITFSITNDVKVFGPQRAASGASGTLEAAWNSIRKNKPKFLFIESIHYIKEFL